MYSSNSNGNSKISRTSRLKGFKKKRQNAETKEKLKAEINNFLGKKSNTNDKSLNEKLEEFNKGYDEIMSIIKEYKNINIMKANLNGENSFENVQTQYGEVLNEIEKKLIYIKNNIVNKINYNNVKNIRNKPNINYSQKNKLTNIYKIKAEYDLLEEKVDEFKQVIDNKLQEFQFVTEKNRLKKIYDEILNLLAAKKQNLNKQINKKIPSNQKNIYQSINELTNEINFLNRIKINIQNSNKTISPENVEFIANNSIFNNNNRNFFGKSDYNAKKTNYIQTINKRIVENKIKLLQYSKHLSKEITGKFNNALTTIGKLENILNKSNDPNKTSKMEKIKEAKEYIETLKKSFNVGKLNNIKSNEEILQEEIKRKENEEEKKRQENEERIAKRQEEIERKVREEAEKKRKKEEEEKIFKERAEAKEKEKEEIKKTEKEAAKAYFNELPNYVKREEYFDNVYSSLNLKKRFRELSLMLHPNKAKGLNQKYATNMIAFKKAEEILFKFDEDNFSKMKKATTIQELKNFYGILLNKAQAINSDDVVSGDPNDIGIKAKINNNGKVVKNKNGEAVMEKSKKYDIRNNTVNALKMIYNYRIKKLRA